MLQKQTDKTQKLMAKLSESVLGAVSWRKSKM